MKIDLDGAFAGAIFIICVFVSFWLFLGEPDIQDAIIEWLKK